MPRKECKLATRGSQRWLQHLVNDSQVILDTAIGLGPLNWLSPLSSDGFSEYADAAFIERLGVSLPLVALHDFWPRGGPVWDGLALTSAGEPVLVEAKAHIPETFSSCGAIADASITLIRKSLERTKLHVGADDRHDWMIGFYQYANRLAHAHLLNELNGVRSHLVFLDFCGDSDMGGPESRAEWESATMVLHHALGITGKLPTYVKHAYVDLRAIAS